LQRRCAEACFLEGLYGKLVNMTAALSRAKRGLLLDADDKPLGSADRQAAQDQGPGDA
jgi:hypothetical protein